MAAVTTPPLAGESAPGVRLGAALRIALSTAALLVAPWHARPLVAQNSAMIRASAAVTHSVIGARLLPDSLAARAASPYARQIRIADLGTLDVSQPGEDGSVAPRLERTPGQPDVVVLVAYVGS
jgi:hypothetical protein